MCAQGFRLLLSSSVWLPSLLKSSVAVVVYKKFCEVVFFFGVCKRRILEILFFLVFALLPGLSLWIEVLLVWSRNLHGRIPMR